MAPRTDLATDPGATEALAEQYRDLRYEELPADVVWLAKQCLIDWLGVTLAGCREPVSAILAAELLDQGANPQATIIGRTPRVSAHQAAMANGTAAHALDYDDVLETMLGHPSAPIYAAVLALGEAEGRSGRDCLTAFVAGVEIASRLGRLVTPSHYELGFHTTGTIGTLGAAAACAHLLGLDPDEWRAALGIAATQAAGLKAVFGTMSKPFHAGKAAANGLLAASLARRGMTSSPGIIEAERGFASTMSAGLPRHSLASRGSTFDIRGMLFKYHASCYHTHSAIEGALAMRDQGVDPISVERIELRIKPGLLGTCAIPEPTTGLEGKFSLRFATALALITGDASEASFTDGMVTRPDLIELRDRVELVVDETLTDEFAIPMTTHTRSGRHLSVCVNVGVPAPTVELGRQSIRLESKFRSLSTPTIGHHQSGRILEMVANLETADSIDCLFEALRLPVR
jgi:2-methylcitrate dehydratase PrpD